MANFDFGDFFDVDKNSAYHRLSMPNNIFAKDIGLYAFSSGELFDVLKKEKSICVAGDEAALTDASIYDDDFALETVNKIFHNQKDVSSAPNPENVKLDHWTNAFIKKKLTDYGDEVHGGSGIAGVIQQHAELVTLPSGGAFPNDEAYQELLQNRKDFASSVIRSPSGLYWNMELSFLFGTSGVDGADCIKTQNTLFTCMLYNFDSLANSKRQIAIKGQGTDGPMFMAAPSTAYGRAGMPNMSAPGTFADIADGGLDNPQNSVAAPLEMSFERNTGKFEAGTKQLVAVLLTPLEGVVPLGINPDDFHLLPMDNFLDATSSTHMGQHELAEAMPVGVKNSNPNIYGPDKKAGPCDEGEEKETIVVVNRSQQQYAKGERVLVGWISGEWLVLQSMEGADVQDSFQIHGWTDIFNMIGLAGHMSNKPETAAVVTNAASLLHPDDAEKRVWDIERDPSKNEESFRHTFYKSMWYTTVTNSFHYAVRTADLLPLNKLSVSGNFDHTTDNEYDPGYTYQYTQFDMLHPQLGGANSMGNMIANCHQYENTLGNEYRIRETTSMGAKPFAGMSFPDGYQNDKIEALKFWADAGKLQASGGGTYAYNYFGGNLVGSVDNPWDINQMFDTNRTPELGEEGVNRHVNAIFESKNNTHIPAEVALNGSVSSAQACPLQSLALLKWATDYPVLKSPGFQGGVKRYRNDFANNVLEYRKHRYHWLEYYADGENLGDLWNLKPRNPAHVTFIPMMAEVATHLDSPHSLHHDGTMDLDVYRNLGGNAKSVPNHPVIDPVNAEQNSTNNDPPSDGTPGSSKLNMFGDRFYDREITGVGFALDPTLPFEMPNNSFEYETLTQFHTQQQSIVKTYPYNTAAFLNQHFGRPRHYSQAALISPNWQSNGVGTNALANLDYGANMVHISTAKIRISTNAAAFRFETDQLLGVNFETTLTEPDEPRPQWGVLSDEINSYNTTSLHARIVDAWPEHLTIFDPRCFAVHHFMPGDPNDAPRALWYKGGEPVLYNGQVTDDSSHLPANATFGYSTEEFGNEYYQVEERMGSVDFRVPTSIGSAGTAQQAADHKGRILSAGTVVDSGSLMRKKQDWRVNTIKRGMVKPFHHYKRTIGFSKDDIQIIAAGSGYQAGDIFRGAGGDGRDAWLKVKSVGSNGEITSLAPFKILYGSGDSRCLQDSIGYGFSHDDFSEYIPPSCSVVNPNTQQPITDEDECIAAGGAFDHGSRKGKLVFSFYTGGDGRVTPNKAMSQGVEPAGAEIRAAKGVVWDKFIFDEGQTKRAPELLSLPSKEGKNTEDGNRGIALGIRQKVVNITDDPVGVYDIYLMFKADPSYYTFNEDSQTPNWLNFCDLTISPSEEAVSQDPSPKKGTLKSLFKNYGIIGKILGGIHTIMNSDVFESDDDQTQDPPTG